MAPEGGRWWGLQTKEGPPTKACRFNSTSPHAVFQLEINDVTRAWGLEVDRVELAVEAVLQPPQDSPTGPSLDSTLQQLALHFLGGGLPSVAGGASPLGPGEESWEEGEVPPRALGWLSAQALRGVPSCTGTPAQPLRPPVSRAHGN